jgi:hypothetical protein
MSDESSNAAFPAADGTETSALPKVVDRASWQAQLDGGASISYAMLALSHFRARWPIAARAHRGHMSIGRHLK